MVSKVLLLCILCGIMASAMEIAIMSSHFYEELWSTEPQIWNNIYQEIFNKNSTFGHQSVPKMQRLESLEKLAGLPPPGGTRLNANISEVLKRAHIIFYMIQQGYMLDSLSFYIVIDMDYGSTVGHNPSMFQLSVSEYLNVFNWGDFVVKSVEVKKGSVKISFNITKNRGERTESKMAFIKSNMKLPPVKRSISSSSEKDSGSDERGTTRGETRLAVRFNLTAKYPEIARGRQDDFRNHLMRQLARDIRVPVSSIKDFSISPGATVSLVLTITNDGNNVMDEISVSDAVDDLKRRIRRKRLRLTDLDGKPLLPQEDPVVTEKASDKGITYAVMGVLIAVMVLIGMLITAIYFLAKRTTPRKLRRSRNSRSKAYCDTGIQETGRDSTLSLSGRYSYDSGLWLGPGPEPSFIVPDAPFYRPPTADQLSMTPRPATSVRSRLKRSWNIDPEQTLPPIPDGAELLEFTNSAFNNQRSISEPVYTVK